MSKGVTIVRERVKGWTGYLEADLNGPQEILARMVKTLVVEIELGSYLLLQPYEHEGKDKDRRSAPVNLLDVPINHDRASRPIRG